MLLPTACGLKNGWSPARIDAVIVGKMLPMALKTARSSEKGVVTASVKGPTAAQKIGRTNAGIAGTAPSTAWMTGRNVLISAFKKPDGEETLETAKRGKTKKEVAGGKRTLGSTAGFPV
jgi:hypothetical protein